MSVSAYADAIDFAQYSRAFSRLPREIKGKAVRRTMSNLGKKGRTKIVRDVAKFSSAPQKHIRQYMVMRNSPAGIDYQLRMPWLSFAKLGSKQRKSGVYLRRRGLIKGGFHAKMSSGHENAFIRKSSKRLPIQGLYGPNPAHAVINNEDRYEAFLAEILEEDGADRLLHEVGRLLPK